MNKCFRNLFLGVYVYVKAFTSALVTILKGSKQ